MPPPRPTGDSPFPPLRRRLPEVARAEFGHSHIPWDSTAPGGLRLLDPGSPTDRRRQPHRTYLTVEAAGGSLREGTLHWVASPT